MLNTGIYSGHFHLSPHWAYTVYFMIFFCSGGKDSVRVFCSLSLSSLVPYSRWEATSEAELCLHWHNSGLLLRGALDCTSTGSSCKKKKKMQPVEVMGTGCHMSYCLVGRRQLKSTAMLNDLLVIRMPLQPLIWAAARSFFSHSVHGTSASLFQLLNDGFTSEIQLS